METTMTHDLARDVLANEWFFGSSSTGTVTETGLLETARRYPQFGIGKDIIRDLCTSDWLRISGTSRNVTQGFGDSGQLKTEWPYSYGTVSNIPVEHAGNAQIYEAIRSVLMALFQRIQAMPERKQYLENMRRNAQYRASQYRLFISLPVNDALSTSAGSANTVEFADNQQIFDAIQSLYLSENKLRDRQLATRITALYRDALAEDERILSASLRQFTSFFLAHPDLGFPRIILTPNGTLRVRWIHGAGNFVAIEFTGKPLIQLVAEIPREGGETARYFSDELIDDVVSCARALGASFT